MSNVSGSLCWNLTVAGLSSSVAVNVFWPILTFSFRLMASLPGFGCPTAFVAGAGCGTRSPASQEHRMLTVNAVAVTIRIAEFMPTPRVELLRSRHVDHETVAHVLLHDPLERLVDLLGPHQFDVGLDVPCRAVVDDLLRLGDPADHRPGEALAAEPHRHSAQARLKLPQRPDVHERGIELQHVHERLHRVR